MGTSQSIRPGVSGDPNWGRTSSAISNFANKIKKEIENPSLLDSQKYINQKRRSLTNIVGRYIKAAGGRQNISKGKSHKGGKAAISVGNSLSNFLNDVASNGFVKYTENLKIGDLNNKSKTDIIHYILEDICGPTTNFDESAAKSALDKLFNKILEPASTATDIDAIIGEYATNNKIEDVLIEFFGTYIYEHLSQPIYERLSDTKDEELCNKTMNEIEEFIMSELNVLHSQTGIKNINWDDNTQRSEIVEGIFNNVIEVFANE